MQFKEFDWLRGYGIWPIIPCATNIVTERVSTTAEILKNFPRGETVAAKENRFAAELTEDEVIKLLENATPGNTKKATNYGVKIFLGIYL